MMTKKTSSMLRAAALGTLTTAFVLAAAGMPQATAEKSVFGETVEVQLVNVEVWVTDRQGNPVGGLGADDFDVYEDGQPVTISYFDEIRGVGLPDLALEELEEPGAEPRAPESPRASVVTPGYFVLYFDELFSAAGGRRRLLDDLKAFLESRMVEPEKVLILRQDVDLTVEAHLGSSRADLEAALEGLAKPSPRGVQTWTDEKNALRFIQGEWERLTVLGGTAPGLDPCDFFVDEAFREIQEHVNQSRARLSESLSHLSSAAAFLAGLPGLKTLVYVSDGLTTTPGSNLLSFVKAVCPGRQGNRRLDLSDGMSDAFRTLTRHANANRVAIYTIQSLGLRQANALSSADQRGVRNTIRTLTRYDMETRTQNREGLTFLARETGGRAVVNRNQFGDDLEQIARDMSGYYSLAYAPPHGGDGLEHRIEVRVRGRKVEVRHRPGYRDKSQDQRMAERLESTLFLNLMENPLGVRLGAGQVRQGKKKVTVPLHVVLPAAEVTFLPGESGAVARLKVQVMAQNERNRRTAFTQKIYQVERPADPDQLISLAVPLELGRGVHVVAFGVRDEATQETSYVSTGLDLRPSPNGPGPSPRP